VVRILASRLHPQQGFRPCLGILRLGRRHSEPRLAAACRRALAVGGASYRSVASILEMGLDREPWPEPVQTTLPPVHPNLRGPAYYGAAEEVPC
jgi:hypothetical protein